MAKRKSEGKRQKAEESDLSSVSGDELTVVNDQEAALYEVGQWAGKPHYKCLLCKFDVLDDEGRMLEHIQLRHHPRPAPKRSSSVLVADKRGNDVTDQVADEGDLNGVFEVELKEVDTTIDEHGNEHKTYTIKE